MPEDMRRCFILHYHRGFSAAEVAELLLLPPAEVDAHLEEAQRRLRSWLDDTAP